MKYYLSYPHQNVLVSLKNLENHRMSAKIVIELVNKMMIMMKSSSNLFF